MEKKRLLIVDGHNLFFQMFYGMPNTIISKDGEAIQGVYGFIGALLKIIAQIKPTHVQIFFDKEQDHKRKALLPQYKANRIDYSAVEKSENPFVQYSYLLKALDEMKLAWDEVSGMEADDAMASLALKAEKEAEVIIASMDSDLFQLISENIHILRYHGEKSQLVDAEAIQKKYGVSPSQMAALKALVGDTSDNISGVPRVGIKTAAKLLNQFGTLENLLKMTEHIERESVRRAIEENRALLQRNIALIELKEKNEIALKWEEIAVPDKLMNTRQILIQIGLLKRG